jgi:hypothetical protein
MIKPLVILALSCFLTACMQSTHTNASVNASDIYVTGDAQSNDLPKMQFDAETFDFGMLTEGERVSHAFYFKNTGKRPLIISAAEGSCGCTVPEYPKDPIPPGESGIIKVTFNSEQKQGKQEKTITVVTNCEPSTRLLRIYADIIVAKTAPN